MQVLFCTSTQPGALLIRSVTWSAWSHVALVDGDYVIEATWPRVRRVPLANVLAKHSRYVIADIACRNPALAMRAARSQVGKPYDLAARVGFMAHRDWQDDSRWLCSELVAWCFERGGPLFRPTAAKISPNQRSTTV